MSFQAKGFPDIGTRLFLRNVSDALDIPILAVMDWDPYGVEILLVYATGSKAMAHDAENLSVPSIKWLGIHGEDLAKVSRMSIRLPCLCQVPTSCKQPLSGRDKKKAKELLDHPSLVTRPKWKHELEVMLREGYKAEIQALASLSLSYLCDEYLIHKTKHELWI